VPVPDGSIVDMLFEVETKTDVAAVNDAVVAAAAGPMAGIVAYQTDPIVSVDILGDPHSSIFDSGLTQVIDGHLVKVGAWYDNEYGYSVRLLDLAVKLAG
jgi:glyceraldehyde 3-phosphate dehydrogenase